MIYPFLCSVEKIVKEAYPIFQDFSEVPNDELVLGRQSSLLHVVLKKLRLDIMKHLQWRTHTKTYEDMCPLLILNFLNWLVLVYVMFLWFTTRHNEKNLMCPRLDIELVPPPSTCDLVITCLIFNYPVSMILSILSLCYSAWIYFWIGFVLIRVDHIFIC